MTLEYTNNFSAMSTSFQKASQLGKRQRNRLAVLREGKNERLISPYWLADARRTKPKDQLLSLTEQHIRLFHHSALRGGESGDDGLIVLVL